MKRALLAYLKGMNLIYRRYNFYNFENFEEISELVMIEKHFLKEDLITIKDGG